MDKINLSEIMSKYLPYSIDYKTEREVRECMRVAIQEALRLAADKAKTKMPWFAGGPGGAFSVTVDKDSILNIINLIE